MRSVMIFRTFMALEPSLLALEQLTHWSWLPLGGGSLQQIGLAFIAATVVDHLMQLRSGRHDD